MLPVVSYVRRYTALRRHFCARSVKTVWWTGVEVVRIDYATLTVYNPGTTGAGKTLEAGEKCEILNFVQILARFYTQRAYRIVDRTGTGTDRVRYP